MSVINVLDLAKELLLGTTITDVRFMTVCDEIGWRDSPMVLELDHGKRILYASSVEQEGGMPGTMVIKVGDTMIHAAPI